jgi:hypothetical protein
MSPFPKLGLFYQNSGKKATRVLGLSVGRILGGVCHRESGFYSGLFRGSSQWTTRLDGAFFKA